MKIFRISQNITVDSEDIWSEEKYLEEVYTNILEGRTTKSQGKLPIVTKVLDMPGVVFIMDGHHRITEGIMNGQTRFIVEWNPHARYIDAGIGNEIPKDAIRVIDFLKKEK